jgi:hypothetical protein
MKGKTKTKSVKKPIAKPIVKRIGIKHDEKKVAKELFFNTTLNQKQIAEFVDVHEHTIGEWIKTESWDILKEAQSNSQEKVLAGLYSELHEITTMVQARPAGQRFADAKEADARRKIVSTIKDLEKTVSLAHYVQVMIHFMEFLTLNNDLDLAKKLNPIANQFIMEKTKLSNATAK